MEALQQVVADKLQCNICLEKVGVDACETHCNGSHTFCFPCICKHAHTTFVRNGRNTEVRCPTCRTGECAVRPSAFLRELSSASPGEALDTEWLVHYRDSLGAMKQAYPNIFFEQNPNEITASQMYAYRNFRLNPIGFFLRRRRSAPVPHVPSGCFVAVNIDEQEFRYTLTSFDAKANAVYVARNSPERFTLSFVLSKDRREGHGFSMVMQLRPVEIAMATPIMFRDYMDETLGHEQMIQEIETEIAAMTEAG